MIDAREELEDAIRDVYDPWSDTPREIADAILAKFPGIRDVIEGPVPPRKTIAERIAFDATVNNRARDIAEIRELFTLATSQPEWEYGIDTNGKIVFGHVDVVNELSKATGGKVLRRRKAGEWEEVSDD